MRSFILGVALAATGIAEVTPLTKVLQLLTSLQAQVVSEGKSEAATYEKFACFCNDGTAEKTALIEQLDSSVAELTGRLEALAAQRNTLDGEITELEADIATKEGEIQDENKRRRGERKVYETNALDLSKAIQALQDAVRVLKASDKTGGHSTGLVAVRATVERAVSLAQALDIPAVPVSDYDYHSGGIIGTLEGLTKDFIARQTQHDAEEQAAGAASDSAVQAFLDMQGTYERDLNGKRQTRAVVVTAVGDANGDLTADTAELHDTQNYLQDLTAQCNAKSVVWDQRTAVRAEELTALSQALEVVKYEVDARITEQTFRGPSQNISFVQISAHQGESPLTRARAVVDAAASHVHSTLLSSLSAHLRAGAEAEGSDSLAKISVMIQELIERLQQEAADEGNHHGWCVEQTKRAEATRDAKSENIRALNSSLAQMEAKESKLSADLAELLELLESLDEQIRDAKNIRDEEALENQLAITDAEAGKSACESALQIVDRFYKAAHNMHGNKSLLQGPTADDLPDAGFDGKYEGAQGESKGVIGMLEVIIGDFDRTVKKATLLEAEQHCEWTAMDRELREEEAAAHATNHSKVDEHVRTVTLLSESNADLDRNVELLGNAVAELVQLHQTCVEAGKQSYEDRVAAREEEIGALKKALCILSHNGEDECM